MRSTAVEALDVALQRLKEEYAATTGTRPGKAEGLYAAMEIVRDTMDDYS